MVHEDRNPLISDADLLELFIYYSRLMNENPNPLVEFRVKCTETEIKRRGLKLPDQ